MDISCTVSVALLDKDVLKIITANSREEPENDQFRKTSLRTHTISEGNTHAISEGNTHTISEGNKPINVKHSISVRETCDNYVITYIMAARCADGFLAIVNGPDH